MTYVKVELKDNPSDLEIEELCTKISKELSYLGVKKVYSVGE